MRFVLVFIFLFTSYSSFCQVPQLPYEQVVKHLIAAGDMPRQQRWEDGYQKLVITKLFGNDVNSLYLFCSSTQPHYNHILLKNRNNYRILSCENFAQEFEVIDEYVAPVKDSVSYDHMAALVAWYKTNLSRDTVALRKLPATKAFQFGSK